MCRGKSSCSELDLDPAKWNTKCPLEPPAWQDSQITLFVKAVEQFVSGNRDECIQALSKIKDKQITEWFVEHGQMSGRHRMKILALPKPKVIADDLRDPLRAPKKYQNEVFERDSYHCRYCGCRLISQDVLKIFIKKLNSDNFRRAATNAETHGIIHIAWPVADHVVPWNIGGQTKPENLVTSCASCNYGKDGYTCEQMGIENPFKRSPIKDSWDGLTSKLGSIKSTTQY